MVEPVSMAGGPGRADRSEGDGDERSALAIRLLELCGFSAEKQLVLSYRQGGHSHLAVVRKDTGAIEEIETPYTEISYLRAEASRVVFLGGSPTEFSSVVTLDLMTRKIEVLRRARDVQLDAGYVSAAEPIAFPTENGLTAYGFFYPPKNRDYTGPEGEQPPLIVMSHGGPTAAADSGLNLGVQYWTSRASRSSMLTTAGAPVSGGPIVAGSTASGGSWMWTTA